MAHHLALETEIAPENGEPEMTAVPEYRITVARIETAARREQEEHVRVTFQVEREPISFRIPVLLSAHDFDDTEMILVARNALHRTFVELAAMSADWVLTPSELQRLSSLNSRPAKPAGRRSRIGIAR